MIDGNLSIMKADTRLRISQLVSLYKFSGPILIGWVWALLLFGAVGLTAEDLQ